MSTVGILSSHINKLAHPIQEIRERALQQLIAKLRLGWELDDELARTRELLETLLAWFQAQQPGLQQEALSLLLTTIKSQAGAYIVKEIGVHQLLRNLDDNKFKICDSALEIYDDVIETLRFLNTVDSEENVAVPRLNLPSITSSESECGTKLNYGTEEHFYGNSKGSSLASSEDPDHLQPNREEECIQVMLLPWVDLCSSDSKTLLLIEDALKLVKSTRRCCRFIRDVFLRDFPPEVFLNRPAIVQRLLSLLATGQVGRPSEILEVLLCITQALQGRLQQLLDPELAHTAFLSPEVSVIDLEQSGLDLELLAQELSAAPREDRCLPEERLVALQQLPVPLYCLDALHTLLATMARSLLFNDATDKNQTLEASELNTCTSVVSALVKLLLVCVTEEFWRTEHTTRTHKDIAHKGCMAMRLLGDLLNKYSSSFAEDSERWSHRTAWLRLLFCAESLLSWARHSALPPPVLVGALQAAQIDSSVALFYPGLSSQLSYTLQITKTNPNQEYRKKYEEALKLFACIEDTIRFMKNTNSCHSSKSVIAIIKKSVAAIDLHNSESYLKDIGTILLYKLQDWNLEEAEWGGARSICLILMSHSAEWVSIAFYKMMAELVVSVLTGSGVQQTDNEKSLFLLFDVGILTEICCHGLSSQSNEVRRYASEAVVYLLRGRLLLSESSWWRLLASLLPILPLLHCYAAHDTELGQAVCKSLEPEIAECMGVSRPEVIMGLVRLLFVRCPSVQMDAAHILCHLLDDEDLLPPKESLRPDVLVSVLRRLQPREFNVDLGTLANKHPQTTSLVQTLEVLKQDLALEEPEYRPRSSPTRPSLEPSLRRATLQQLAVLMQQPALHDVFLQHHGLSIVTALLRLSLKVEDYLAFPECALSCVSVLNSVCSTSRLALSKTPQLPTLLLRVLLVFPTDDVTALMTAQVLCVIAWAGFALQELDQDRRRVLAFPCAVVDRTLMPFPVQAYWKTSTNALHSSIEWLLNEEQWRAAVRVRWSVLWCGLAQLLRGDVAPVPVRLRPTLLDLATLQASEPLYASTKALIALQNATSHRSVHSALAMLQGYVHLMGASSVYTAEYGVLPWSSTLIRFLTASPASPRDVSLLIEVLKLLLTYMDHVPLKGNTNSRAWIVSAFLESNDSMIVLLNRQQLFPEQSLQESIEITQLHIGIVKVLVRCNLLQAQIGEYDDAKWESLFKILLACLESIDLKNFHLLGYLNEVLRCIRYASNSQYCLLSEESTITGMRILSKVLGECAVCGSYKGQACRLDALLSLLALLSQARSLQLPVQRWSEWCSEEVLRLVGACGTSGRPELRAVSLRLLATLANYTPLLPHLHQAVGEECLVKYAASMLAEVREANVVRASAAALLTALASRVSPATSVFESDMMDKLREYKFLEVALNILVEFCSKRQTGSYIEPNVPLLVLEQRGELEVRAKKQGLRVSPGRLQPCAPPSAALVAALADLLHNLAGFARCPLQVWDERGLFRLLYRCTWSSSGLPLDVWQVRASACRGLARIADTCENTRRSLSEVHDCLHALLQIYHPTLPESEDLPDNVRLIAYTHAYILLGTLLEEPTTCSSLWRSLVSGNAPGFFQVLLQSIRSQKNDLKEAAFYCISQLMNATCYSIPKQSESTDVVSSVEFFDELKSPLLEKMETAQERDKTIGSGDCISEMEDCQPEYISEQLCKTLMQHYRTSLLNLSVGELSLEESWVRGCRCLAALMSRSARSRRYAVHRQFHVVLLASLQDLRNALSMHGQPAEVLRNAATNPVLRTLYWVIVLIDSSMIECVPAKEVYAENNIAHSLNKLWPWFMMTEQLREAIVHLLKTFVNNCPKAWGAMASCVSGRCLVVELCALAAREMALLSRTHSLRPLSTTLDALRHCTQHHHCRSLILKSDLLLCLNKLHPSVTRRRGAWARAEAPWERLTEALARHADGAARVLELPAVCALAAQARRFLPVLAHAAHHHRARMLQATEVLEVLSGALVNGELPEVVAAAHAVWALAANNHKAKLVLRTCGLASSVAVCLQRLRHSGSRDSDSERALQLLTYTHRVLALT